MAAASELFAAAARQSGKVGRIAENL